MPAPKKSAVREEAPLLSTDAEALAQVLGGLGALAPLVTRRALELAGARICKSRMRLVGNKGRRLTGDTEGTVKVALLLVRRINPLEYLTNEEEAFLRGIHADTYAKGSSGSSTRS